MQHSDSPLTVNINGQDVQFGQLRFKDLLEIIEWANARVRKEAVESIPTSSVQDSLAIFRATRNYYTIDSLSELLNDPAILAEGLFRAYQRAKPDSTREEFDALFALLDLGSLTTYFNEITGMADEEADPTPAAAESEMKSADSAKPSPPSASDTKE